MLVAAAELSSSLSRGLPVPNEGRSNVTQLTCVRIGFFDPDKDSDNPQLPC